MTSRGKLSITLKTGDSFSIGGNILVTLKEKRGSYIALAVYAPKELKIDRYHAKETRDAVQRESSEVFKNSPKLIRKKD